MPPSELLPLVARYIENRQTYLAPGYNETSARRELIDPLFRILGWDIDNSGGVADAYKDVVHEDSLRIAGRTTAPDYSFRVGGMRKFFVEAKRPSVDITTDPLPALQLRRYAWSAGLPFSIVTNFEHLAVYDCRPKPHQADSARTARILLVPHGEFDGRWAELDGLISRRAVWSGAYDRAAASRRAPRGTERVDAAFLLQLENARTQLAVAIARRNPGMSSPDLTFAVQQTLDRIIFLRICEDRGIEPYGRLETITRGVGIYARLLRLFREADRRYNSGLFHLRRNTPRAGVVDRITPDLDIDDRTLELIIRDFYFPQSPYEFAVIPPEILGRAYETFLGSVIVVRSPTQVVVEQKPEVRHAGGVFYTPRHIVETIVRQTLDPLLANRAPRDVEQVSVVDPACGSGSFLTVVYERLLAWHLAWYLSNDPARHTRGRTPRLFRAGEAWRLTTAEKRRILTSNVFGVDIDPQAVEVTKLSLLLRMLEDESAETIGTTLCMFDDGALPDLDANICVGNSLLAAAAHITADAASPAITRVRGLNWSERFPAVFARGGFDAVVGNPPYIRIQTLHSYYPAESDAYRQAFADTMPASADIFVPFVVQGLALLRPNLGRLGYILPNKLFTNDYASRLRGMLARGRHVERIVDFGHHQVFEDATTYTSLLFLTSAPNAELQYTKALPATPEIAEQAFAVASDSLGEDVWVFQSPMARTISSKLRTGSVPLGELGLGMNRGSSTGADDVFMLLHTAKGYTTRAGAPVEIEEALLRRPIYATDFGRYRFNPVNEERVIYPYVHDGHGDVRALTEDELRASPLAYEYLRSRRRELQKRKQFRDWYGYSAPRSLAAHEQADLLIPLLALRGSLAALPHSRGRYCLMAGGGFSLTLPAGGEAWRDALLAYLNSDVAFWFLRQVSSPFRGNWITCTKQFVEQIPVPTAVLDPSSALGIALGALARQATDERAGGAYAASMATRSPPENEIDELLARAAGLTHEELDFILTATRIDGSLRPLPSEFDDLS